MRWIIAITICGLLAAGGTLWWRGGGAQRTIPPDRIIEARRGGIVRGVVAVGRVEPRTRVELKSKANGVIQRLLVDVADSVTRGQVLIELDQEILRARLDQMEGRVAQARGALLAAQASARRSGIEKSDPELVFAERNWERARQLYGDGLVSDDELDVVKDRHESALYRLRLLEASVEMAAAEQIAAEGRLKEYEAEAELARQELAEATIRSPIDGVVLHRYLEEGDSVSSIRSAGGNASVVMTLGDLSELYVDGEVDEVDVGAIIAEQRIRPDLHARVQIESLGGRSFRGVVTRIAPLGLEDRNGIVTFEVRIVLDNPEKLLLANMTANSLIVLEEKDDVLLVSQGALISDGSARFALVWDAATGESRRREVEVGITDGSRVEITAGLENGEKIVIP